MNSTFVAARALDLKALHLPLVAILRGIRVEEVLPHMAVLIEQGFEAIEIPSNSPDWQQSMQVATAMFSSRAFIGGGTIVETSHVDCLLTVGAQFAVTPNTDSRIIEQCARHRLPTLVGCMTPSEAFAALHAGASALKLFPASSLSMGHIGSLKSVLPEQVALYAVGGVAAHNMHAYLDAGCSGVGLGKDLYCSGQSVEQTKIAAQKYVQAYRQGKS